MQYRLTPHNLFTAGYHQTQARSLGDEAKTAYMRLEYDRETVLGKVRAVGRTKRVRDDIADRVFGLGGAIYLEPEPIPLFSLTNEELRNPLGIAVLQDDPMLLRNSWLHTIYVKATLKDLKASRNSVSKRDESSTSDFFSEEKCGLRFSDCVQIPMSVESLERATHPITNKVASSTFLG